jgi:hypothetical protein
LYVLFARQRFIPVLLDCGDSSSENCTYLVLSQTTAQQPLTCVYNICPTNPTVCRFRLDFNVRKTSFYLTLISTQGITVMSKAVFSYILSVS